MAIGSSDWQPSQGPVGSVGKDPFSGKVTVQREQGTGLFSKHSSVHIYTQTYPQMCLGKLKKYWKKV